MSLDNVLNVLHVLSEYLWARDGSLQDAQLQGDVSRLSLASVYHLSAVLEEFCHPAGSTAVNSEPSSQNVHEDGMVSGIDGGRQIEQDQGTDVT